MKDAPPYDIKFNPLPLKKPSTEKETKLEIYDLESSELYLEP